MAPTPLNSLIILALAIVLSLAIFIPCFLENKHWQAKQKEENEAKKQFRILRSKLAEMWEMCCLRDDIRYFLEEGFITNAELKYFRSRYWHLHNTAKGREHINRVCESVKEEIRYRLAHKSTTTQPVV